MSRYDAVVPKLVRGSVLVIAALALTSIVIGFLPGYAVYEHGELVGHRPAGGAELALLATWLAVPGIVVWLHPRPAFAFAWSVLAWIGLVAWFVATFELSLELGSGREIVSLWPAQALSVAVGSLLVALLIVLPAGALAHGVVVLVRRRRARLAALASAPPVARVHRER